MNGTASNCNLKVKLGNSCYGNVSGNNPAVSVTMN